MHQLLSATRQLTVTSPLATCLALRHGRVALAALLCTSTLLQPDLAHAHHGTFTFDGDTVITLEGQVERFNWTNPHGSLVLRVAEPDGSTRDYFIEADGPSLLGPLGVTADSLQRGDAVLAYVSPSRNPRSSAVLGREILKADGTVVGLSVAYARRLQRAEPPAATSVLGTWVPDQQALFAFVQSRSNWPLTDAGATSVANYDILAPFSQTACIPATAPTVMMYPTAKVLRQVGSEITLDADWMGAHRTVHMDASGHPQPPQPSLQGHSIGRWEGNALVIDTAQFTPNAIGNIFGVASGPDKHLQERFTLAADRRSLRYEYTLADAAYIQGAVSGSYQWHYRPDVAASSEACDMAAASRHLDNPEP